MKRNKQKGFTFLEAIGTIFVLATLFVIYQSDQADKQNCKDFGGTYLSGRTNHCLVIDDGKIVRRF